MVVNEDQHPSRCKFIQRQIRAAHSDLEIEGTTHGLHFPTCHRWILEQQEQESEQGLTKQCACCAVGMSKMCVCATRPSTNATRSESKPAKQELRPRGQEPSQNIALLSQPRQHDQWEVAHVRATRANNRQQGKNTLMMWTSSTACVEDAVRLAPSSRGIPHYGPNISLKQRPTPVNEREKGSDVAALRLGRLRFRGQSVWVTQFLGRRPL